MSKMGVRNLAGYNTKIARRDQARGSRSPIRSRLTPDQPEPLDRRCPLIVVVIDELADLMMVVRQEDRRTHRPPGAERRARRASI